MDGSVHRYNPRRWQPTDIEPFARSVIADAPEEPQVHVEPFHRGELRLLRLPPALWWVWARRGHRLGAGMFLPTGPHGHWQESEAALVRAQRGKGRYGEILQRIRCAVGEPIYSDGTMTLANERVWVRLGATLLPEFDAYELR